ncbi:hypothetical protein C5Y93_22730 [Blastopirellula marina]|uniref:Uncharacterized protein n=2 Tax=Blastopirellula marina TaxID=124 RepID=A0A2S8GGC1_9BACT|nr:hypothetical protein C5Y93_22730 [Blastopirellula marina]
MTVIPEAWKLDPFGDAILDAFALGNEYKHFAIKVHWKKDAKPFQANLTLRKKGRSDGICLPNATCIHCTYDNEQVAWRRQCDGPDLLLMTFRVDGQMWQQILRLYPRLRNLEQTGLSATGTMNGTHWSDVTTSCNSP